MKEAETLLTQLFGDNIPKKLTIEQVSQSIETCIDKGMSKEKSINHIKNTLKLIYKLGSD